MLISWLFGSWPTARSAVCELISMVVCFCLITDAHEYGLPMLAVQKCLEIHHPFRNRHGLESFVKFELISAGIGNRLFPYLAARAIAYRFNKTLLHVRHSDSASLRALNFDPDCEEFFEDEVNTAGVPFMPYHTAWIKYNNQTIYEESSYSIGGYTQNHKFADFPVVREKIWKGLEFQPGAIKKSADECIKVYKSHQGLKTSTTTNISSRGSTGNAPLVCVHIRLGDKFRSYRNEDETINYDDNKENQYAHWVPNADFIRVGLQWFDATLVRARYLVFSDTMKRVRAWNVQQYTANKVTLLPDLQCNYSSDANMKDGPPHTLIELSMFLDHCDHFLLTAGTFAYWPGWKSAGHVLLSKLQFVSLQNNKTFWTKADEDDYFPPNVRLVEPCEGQLDRFCTVSAARDPLWNQWKTALVASKDST